MNRAVPSAPAAAPLKISVVVPAFNEQKLIRRSVKAIHQAAEAFTRTGWGYEVIVCDNNSNDQTAEYARAAGAHVVFEPVNQISRARNRGASAATGEWLVFVDADSYPCAGLFGDVAEHIARGEHVGGGAVVHMEHAPRGIRLVAQGWNLLSRWQRWMAGSFIWCEAGVFRELGGFSHELYAAEEIEFSRRLHRVAARLKKRVTILNRYPLKTSARKAYLYSTWDHLKFVGKNVLGVGRPLRDRSQCGIWYEGRR